MLKTMRRDTAGFVLASMFVGSMILDAVLCIYLAVTLGWITGACVALISVQVLLIAFLWALRYLDKFYEEDYAQIYDSESGRSHDSLVFPLSF